MKKFFLGIFFFFFIGCSSSQNILPTLDLNSIQTQVAETIKASHQIDKGIIVTSTVNETYNQISTPSYIKTPTAIYIKTNTKLPTPSQTHTPLPTLTSIPTPYPTPTRNPNPFPTVTNSPIVLPTRRPSGPVDIMNTNYLLSNSGNLVFLGEVRNNSTKTYKNIDAIVTLKGAANVVVDWESSRVDLPFESNIWSVGLLYPGEQAPFEIIIQNPGNWENYTLEVKYEVATEKEIAKQFRGLNLRNISARPIDDFIFNFQISGEVLNLSTITCGPVWYVATLFDASNQVVGLGKYFSDTERLYPQQKDLFKIQIYARGNVYSYRVLSSCYIH